MDLPSRTAARSVPDPRGAETAEQYVGLLRGLRAWSGLTFRQLEKRAVTNGDVLPYSTIHAALARPRLPREELLTAYLRACGCTPQEVAIWVDVRRRLTVTTAGERPLGGPRPGDDTGRPAPGRRTAAPPRRGLGRAWANLLGRRWPATVAGLVLVLGTAGGAARSPEARPSAPEADLLTSDRCPALIALGEYGQCAQRLQESLQQRGLKLPADASFGPYTRMRVTAFQVLTGLPPTGMGDGPTKTALLSRGAATATWPKARIARRLNEVFGSSGGEAMVLAKCLSLGDPLWIAGPDRQGVRRWGLFQFTDLELLRLRAGPAQALDPEWNIQAAHGVWQRTGDFSHWSCESPNDAFGLLRPSGT
ncbi:peptidoglycan-binding domain-containing protein [Actinomadura sp. HBU206391]|uniref:peptidoglycan-binding domain-containing protein n=1 Tax=Actinomadura sp. HBU206391 TaxID=2731692 RepID=UPI0016504D47|nr:peptidoglycan-binding protein [Actinomadura sp. HBU206391]MBC6459733.1 peptidoglycan-binding protein [Actinomadura sp. HBU206391]